MILRRRTTKNFVEIDGLLNMHAWGGKGNSYCDFLYGTFSFRFSSMVEWTVLSEIELFHEGGNKKNVCVRVGYIGNLLMSATTRTTPQRAVLGY
jgi:hypothetical protein